MTGVAVHGFPGDEGPVARLAGQLGAPSAWIDLKTFPDGETLPTVPVAGAAATVILYRSLHQPNDRLIPLLQAADAYRRAGVTRLVLAAPYLCYLRQDAVFQPGQPLSRDVIGPLLGRVFDRIVTVQAHLHRTRALKDVFGVPSDNLDIGGDLAALAAGGRRPLIIGPDSESRAWVEAAADRLGLDWAVFDKQRLGDREVRLTLDPSVPITGRDVLLLDDICSSGGTLAQATLQLREAGAARVDVAVAHALFDDQAEARLRAAGVGRILSSNAVPHPTNALDLASVLAGALRNETSA